MASIETDIANSAAASQRALRLFNEHLERFGAACRAGDWETAEKDRQKALAAIDAYCDHLAAMHKRVEREP